MTSLITSELVQAMKAGDAAAFNKIYRVFNQRIFVVCCKKLSIEDAEDITSEAFAVLWDSRMKMETVSDVRDFLYIVTSNKTLRLLKRRRQLEQMKEDDVILVMDRKDDLEEHEHLMRIVLSTVDRQLSLLRPQPRIIFNLYIEQHSPEDIALFMRLDRRTIYAHIGNVRKKILAAMGRKGIRLTGGLLTREVPGADGD